MPLIAPGAAHAQPAKQQSQAINQRLLALPRPTSVAGKVSPIFSASTYQQTALNFQAKLAPDAALKFYQTQLAKLQYSERKLNTTSGQWGFSIVFDLPSNAKLPAKDPGRTVVLVVQSVMLSPDTINLNVRFEEI